MTAWLLDTLIYTGMMIALVLALRRPVSQHFGPQIAYMLWGVPFLRLLLPPVVLPASLAPESAAAPFAAPQAAAPVGSTHWVEAASAAPPPSALPVAISPPASLPPAWDWGALAQFAAGLWLASALAFLVWRVVTYRRMRAGLLAHARPVGEIGSIRLVETPALAAPVAFGVLDKVIALPPLFMAQPDTVARDLAIQHELEHHRGHDLLANMAAQALLALHWFNPLAWYGWRAMRRDQEAACDARVLAGRGRDERALYAALIVDIAAGPRLALAAPMACPVLGDKSVIHRLRSMSMSEVTPGRRWFGRGLIFTAAALALPLTASISYSVASAQEPDGPVPQPPAPLNPLAPLAPPAPLAPLDPDAPEAPAAPEAVERQVHTFVLRREGEGREPAVRGFGSGRHGPTPPVPPMLRFEFPWGEPSDPDFEKNMAEWGQQMEQWGEQYAEQMEQWTAEHEGQALALSEQALRNAPEVVHSCDQADLARTTTADGRRRIVICTEVHERMAARAVAGANAHALAGLRNARGAIARNRGMSAEIRREVLDDLDAEIRRMERGED